MWNCKSYRRKEVKVVKDILAQHEYKGIKVGHKKGRGYGWLLITTEIETPKDCRCPECRERCEPCQKKRTHHRLKIKEIARQATGRHGEHDDIVVQID